MLSDDTYTYEYDDEGNLVYRYVTNDTGERTYYTWDHRNRLTHVSQLSGDHELLIVDYAYDASNQLVYVRTDKPFEEGESSTVFAYDGGQVALEFDEAGSNPMSGGDLSHRYLWGPEVDQLFADEQVDWSDSDADGQALWAMTDNQGSVRDVIDSSGKARVHRRFDTFGKVVDEVHRNASGTSVTSGQTGFVDEAFQFTGRWFDKNTNLQNNLNRWYDPGTGRWPSEDPIGFEAGDANLYRYVGNSPTQFTDPSGLWWYPKVCQIPFDWYYGNFEKEQKIAKKQRELQFKLAQEPKPDPQMVKDIDAQCRRPVGPANANLMEQLAKEGGKRLIH